MRKNYFAKKFVAYSMAFAVAFSTLTVSPVFVKEAKAAAGDAAYKFALDVGDIEEKISANSMIVGPIRTTNANADFVDISTFKNTLGFSTSEKIAGVINDSNMITTLVANDSDIDAAGEISVEDVAFNNVDRKSNNLGHDVGNVNFEYTSKIANSEAATTSWFKLVPHKKEASYSYSAVTEKLDVTYYTFEPVSSDNLASGDTNQLLKFAEVNADQLGTYVAVTTASGEINDIVIIKEKSDLNAYANQKTVKTLVGQNAVLGIDATGSRTISYTWTRNGKELGNEAQLKITEVKSADFGTYTCKVSDGLKTENISVTLSETKTTDASSAACEIETYRKVLDATETALVNNETLIETQIPQNDNFVYVWFNGNNITTTAEGLLTTEAKANYTASNKNITINAMPTLNKITVIAVDKDEYARKLETELKNVEKASSYEKVTKVEDLLNAEDDASLTVLFKETITLVKDSSANVSEVKTVKLGDELSLTAPTVTGATNATTYKWTGANVSNLGSYDTINTNVLSKTIKFNSLGIKDFGTYTCSIDLDGNDGTTTDITVYKVNLVYISDFIATADEIVAAKVGAKDVEFVVNATATLPISYTWNKSINTAYYDDIVVENNDQDANEPTIDVTQAWKETNIIAGTATKENKISIAEITDNNKDNVYTTLNAKGKVDLSVTTDARNPVDDAALGTQQPKYNYYTCTATDGIYSKTFYFGVTESVGFDVSKTVKDIAARKDTKVTLKPVVELKDSKEVTYSWTKHGSSAVISTDKEYTVDFDGTNLYYDVTITDGIQKNVIEFTVSELTSISNDLEDYFVTSDESVVYNGKEQTGNVVVKCDDGVNPVFTLVEGKDYTVSYKENINVGIARYEVSFIGDFANVKNAKNETTKSGQFYIDRADNEVTVADKTVVLGGSVQPKTTNKAGAAVTYTYYTDEACTTALEAAPTKVGTYYVKATSIATTNYNEATSNVATVKVVPGKVKMLGTSRTASSVKLNWNKATGATSYRVYYKAPGAKSYKVFKNTTATSMNVTGLASATTYTFAVKAYAKTAGYSTVYATKQTTTAPAKVATPSVTAGSKKATVKFTKVARATRYQVYMAKGNGSYKKVATTKSLSFTKTGLTKGATYKFKVRAYKTVGSNTYYGAFSSAKAVVVK